MKKFNLFKWMVVLMMLPIVARAQVRNVYPAVQSMKIGMMESTILDQQNYRKVENDRNTSLLYCKPIVKKEASSNDVQVHFVLEYEKDGVGEFALAMYHNQELYGIYNGEDGDDFTMALPKGVWDFCLTFFNDKTVRFTNVIQDLVQIDGDMTITFSEASATNHISIKEYMPDGSEMTVTQYQENESGELEIISEGDVDEIFYNSWVVYKPLGAYGAFYLMYGLLNNVETVERNYTTADADWWVSESKSGRFAFCRNESAYDGSLFGEKETCNTFYINKFVTDKTETAVLKNKPENYFYTEEKFIQSKAGKMWGDEKYPTTWFGLKFYTVINGLNVFTSSRTQYKWTDADNIFQVYNGVTDEDAAPDFSFDLQAIPLFLDNYQQTPWGMTESHFIYGLPSYRINGKPTYVNVGTGNGLGLSCVLPNTNNLFSMKGNPAFSFSPEQKVLPYGSNCPILSFTKYNYDTEWGHLFVAHPDYTGRYGEYRETDIVALEETIKVDGEQVAGSFEEYQQLQGQWIGEGIPTGVFDISLTNKNVEVDGLDGKNEATIHFDMGAEDKEAPTLQMLWFKDKEDKIIDRFAKAEDGTLEFAGGDFNFHFVNEGSYWYDIAEQTVSVSYSPYCKDEWTALEVEEIPENYFAPAFGYFYRGSLKDVTGVGEKGWFDLKIRLEDATGNYQEQVIRPAFRIDDLVDTGIENNNQYTINNKQEVYDVMGRRIEGQQSGIQIVRRQNGDVRKVIVR